MPKVGKKHFSYDETGMAAAIAYADKKGQRVTTRKKKKKKSSRKK